MPLFTFKIFSLKGIALPQIILTNLVSCLDTAKVRIIFDISK